MADEPAARALDEILSKREQQVMEVIHRRGEATAGEIYDELPDAASYNAVRGVLRMLEDSGRVRHRRQGRRYVYRATTAGGNAGATALGHLVRTFFGGSAERLLNTLLESRPPSSEELDRLQSLIDEARERGGAAGDGNDG